MSRYFSTRNIPPFPPSVTLPIVLSQLELIGAVTEYLRSSPARSTRVLWPSKRWQVHIDTAAILTYTLGTFFGVGADSRASFSSRKMARTSTCEYTIPCANDRASSQPFLEADRDSGGGASVTFDEVQGDVVHVDASDTLTMAVGSRIHLALGWT